MPRPRHRRRTGVRACCPLKSPPKRPLPLDETPTRQSTDREPKTSPQGQTQTTPPSTPKPKPNPQRNRSQRNQISKEDEPDQAQTGATPTPNNNTAAKTTPRRSNPSGWNRAPRNPPTAEGCTRQHGQPKADNPHRHGRRPPPGKTRPKADKVPQGEGPPRTKARQTLPRNLCGRRGPECSDSGRLELKNPRRAGQRAGWECYEDQGSGKKETPTQWGFAGARPPAK